MSMTFPSRGAWLLALALTLGGPTAPVAAFDVLLGSSFSRRLSQVDGSTGALEGLFVPPCNLPFATSRGPRLGPDGRIYVGTNGALYRIDASTGAFLDVFVSGLPGTVYFTAVAPDGSIWGTLNDGGNALFHADSSTGALLGPLVGTSSPTGIAVGPDGNLYVGNSATGQVSRFNPTTGALIDVFGTAPGPTAGLSFGADGKLYVSLFSLERHRPLRRHDRRLSGLVHPTRRSAPLEPARSHMGSGWEPLGRRVRALVRCSATMARRARSSAYSLPVSSSPVRPRSSRICRPRSERCRPSTPPRVRWPDSSSAACANTLASRTRRRRPTLFAGSGRFGRPRRRRRSAHSPVVRSARSSTARAQSGAKTA